MTKNDQKDLKEQLKNDHAPIFLAESMIRQVSAAKRRHKRTLAFQKKGCQKLVQKFSYSYEGG